MFKVFEIDGSQCEFDSDSEFYGLMDLNRLSDLRLLGDENFKKTLVSVNNTDILDLNKRSSWTHKNEFYFMKYPDNVTEFFENNNILTISENNFDHSAAKLLKYNPGDFFTTHRDYCLTPSLVENEIHEYTCLIFCPFSRENEKGEGGELVFKSTDGLYNITFNPFIALNEQKFVMVIFSIDMYHEVLPIIKGTRWVFKRPLFTKKDIKTAEAIDPASMDKFKIMHRELLNRGIYLGPSGYEVGFVSAAHSKIDLEKSKRAIFESLDIVFRKN
jgi:hypothetical protein